jgi:hypothetical protein
MYNELLKQWHAHQRARKEWERQQQVLKRLLARGTLAAQDLPTPRQRAA